MSAPDFLAASHVKVTSVSDGFQLPSSSSSTVGRDDSPKTCALRRRLSGVSVRNVASASGRIEPPTAGSVAAHRQFLQSAKTYAAS